MGIVIKQSAISTALTYLGVVIGYINILILFPKYMSPEEVGLARLIQDGAMLLVPFAQLGIGQLTLRYFPEHHSKPQYKELVGLVFSLLIVALTLFTVLFLVFESPISAYFNERAPEVSLYLNYILALVFILAIYHVLVAFSQSSLNIVLPNFLKEILLRGFTLIGIILFARQIISFNQFISLLIGAYFINLVVLVIYLGLKGLLKMSIGLSYFDSSMIKKMLTYSLFTFLGASSILIIGKVDSLMVTGMLGLTELGIYSTAFYIAVLIELPKRAVAQISMPLISRSLKANNIQEVADIYRKSAINNLIIGLLIFIGLWVNLDNIFMLIPRSEVYSMGAMVVLIIGSGKLIDMAAGLNGEILVMSKYYRVNVYLIVGLAAITIIANYLFIPIYGMNGAAIGSALSLILFNLSKYVFLYFKMKLQPFSIKTVKVILIGGGVLFIGLILPQVANIYLDIIYRSAAVIIVYAIANFYLQTSDEINNLLKRFLSRWR